MENQRPMKKLQVYLSMIAMAGLFLAACSGTNDSQNNAEESDQIETSENTTPEVQEEETAKSAGSIVGSWKLSAIEKEGEGMLELSACDQQKVFEFTEEADEPLGDGTEVMKLNVSAEGDCSSESYMAKYTSVNGQLYISKLRTDGLSNSGLFNILEQNSEMLKIGVMKHTYTFTKQ